MSKTSGERFKALLEDLGLSNNAFAKKIGVSSTVINGITNEVHKPGPKVLEAVFDQYPDINPEWLIMGKGEMKRGTASVPSERGGEALESELRERINLQTAMISDLRYTVELQKRLLEGKKLEGAIEKPLWPEELIEIGPSAMLA